MARIIAERMARAANLEDTVFDSAGLLVQKEESAYVEVITFLKHEKYNILNHKSKRLTVALSDNADVILCMTEEIGYHTKQALGDYYAPKVVLLTEAIDLDTKKKDIDPPSLNSVPSLRRLYAAMLAAMGRLVRTLEEPSVKPEYLGAKSVPKKIKPGTQGAATKPASVNIDPQRRRYLVNMIFDFVERSFEAPTSSVILRDIRSVGQELAPAELEELLKQDLHGYLRLDKEGAWHVVPGASQKRREQVRAEARARAQEQEKREEKREEKRSSTIAVEEKMTEEVAYETLSIKPGTAASEAQKKYRALLHRYHPDKFHDDPDFRTMADHKTKRITQAWALVKDKFPDDPVV